MNKYSKALSVAALVLASVSATASEITVGGVTWDPDYQTLTTNDFISTGNFTQWFSFAGQSLAGAPDVSSEFPGTIGSMLQGVGEINSFNGKTDFVCPTCELTFAFGGLEFDGDLTDGSLYNLAGSKGTGYFNIYFDNSADFDGLNLTSQADVDMAIDGSLFLSLSFEVLKEGIGYTPEKGNLDSYWHVSGGAAAGNFDTDTELFGSDLGFGGFVDFKGGKYGTGAGVASGNTIPEPTSLAIFGLALFGLARAVRRKV